MHHILSKLTSISLLMFLYTHALAEPPVLSFEFTPKIALERSSLPDGLPTTHELRFSLDRPLEEGEKVFVDIEGFSPSLIIQFAILTSPVFDGLKLDSDVSPNDDFHIMRYEILEQHATITIDMYADTKDGDHIGGDGTDYIDEPESGFFVKNCIGCVIDPDFQATNIYFYDDPTLLPKTIDFEVKPGKTADDDPALVFNFLTLKGMDSSTVTVDVIAQTHEAFEALNVDLAEVDDNAMNLLISDEEIGFQYTLLSQNKSFGEHYQLIIPVRSDCMKDSCSPSVFVLERANEGYSTSLTPVPAEKKTYRSKTDGIGFTPSGLMLLLVGLLIFRQPSLKKP